MPTKIFVIAAAPHHLFKASNSKCTVVHQGGQGQREFCCVSCIKQYDTIYKGWPWPSNLEQSEHCQSVSGEMFDMAGSGCFGLPLCCPRLALWYTILPSANDCSAWPVCVCNLCACALRTDTLLFSDAALLNEQCASWKLSAVKVIINQCRVWMSKRQH